MAIIINTIKLSSTINRKFETYWIYTERGSSAFAEKPRDALRYLKMSYSFKK